MSATPPLHVVQAFDRAPISDVPTDDAAALESKLTLAARAFRDRSAWPKAHQRMAVLQKAATQLAAQHADFTKLIAREGGKPWRDAAIEVTRAVDGLRNAAEAMRDLSGREVPMGLTPASDARWAFTTKEPLGVVAAISAFNHPLNLIVHQVAPAVAVGCPVIIKPAAATPLSCIRLVALLRDAGLEERFCQTLLTEDNALAEKLATDARVAFVSFIGSARVGWHLRSRLAPGTRCALEHGGAAPVIVDRSARVEDIIEPMAKGAYYHAGQVCVSVQRIFVHEDVLPAFVERFTARVAALRVGDPLHEDTEVGPLIHPREAERVTAWVEEARAAGAHVHGGGALSSTTLRPSVLVEPGEDAKVSRLEVFGPVACVYGFREIDRAIDRANALPFAFQASVFSSEIAPALHCAQRLDASCVLVNDHTAFRTDWMPFAGRRESGYGVGGIPYTMRDMTHEKMVVLRLP